MSTTNTSTSKKPDNSKLMRQTTLSAVSASHRNPSSHGGLNRPRSPQQPETVPTFDEAMEFVIENGYHKKDTQLTTATLSEIMVKMCNDVKTEGYKHTIEGIRCASVILMGISHELICQLKKVKKTEGALKEIKAEMEKATREQREGLEGVKKAAEDSAKDTREAINKVSAGVDELANKMKAMEESMNTRPAQTQGPPPDGRSSYASATAMGIPLRSHANAIARAEDAEKQIVVCSTNKGAKETAAELKTERELIAKADMTIKLMAAEGEAPPANIKFVGGIRTRTGAILYTLNTKEAANWLRRPNRLIEFNEKFREATQTQAKLFNVIAYYVPVEFDAQSKSERRTIESDNDLKDCGLAHTRYIKPEHKRSPNQKTAHVILGFATRDDANAAIGKRWLIIGDKRVAVKKLIAEPRRCYRCQSVKGDHTADKCAEKEPKCARCAGQHLTEKCDKPNNIRCANCDSTNHGAGSRDCPAFKRSTDEHMQRNPESYYKYYPVLGNTQTLELLDGSYGPGFEQRTTNPERKRYEQVPVQRGGRSAEEEDVDQGNESDVDPIGLLKPVHNWADEEHSEPIDLGRLTISAQY